MISTWYSSTSYLLIEFVMSEKLSDVSSLTVAIALTKLSATCNHKTVWSAISWNNQIVAANLEFPNTRHTLTCELVISGTL
jgi:hypothetical protein